MQTRYATGARWRLVLRSPEGIAGSAKTVTAATGVGVSRSLIPVAVVVN